MPALTAPAGTGIEGGTVRIRTEASAAACLLNSTGAPGLAGMGGGGPIKAEEITRKPSKTGATQAK
jgi:hypothetical protein